MFIMSTILTNILMLCAAALLHFGYTWFIGPVGLGDIGYLTFVGIIYTVYGTVEVLNFKVDLTKDDEDAMQEGFSNFAYKLMIAGLCMAVMYLSQM